ncbi:hypothetical protein [Micromonospora zhanjiangensis]|uniref:4Fe-4S Wbl-type domain-containing protein n=1 Tax=Micromonospora zhanjiangensis TaxID=1522057 RepID=A0ABV8KI74_9ACTN
MTGTDDCAPDPLVLTLAAQLTVDQHRDRPDRTYERGTCQQCTEEGCPQLDWAERTLADLTARGGRA